MSFFEELRRRNVFRVAIAYVIAAWLVAQVADLVLENIGAPAWVIQTLFLLLAMGFVAALIIAWAYEVTPEGIRRERDVVRDSSITHHTAKKLDIITIGLLLLGFVVLALDRFVLQRPGPAAVAVQQTVGDVQQASPSEPGAKQPAVEQDDHSIAVLPFADMSPDGDQGYFADGIAEELLNLLARIDGLKVAARTSSFKFKNAESDIVEIGQALKVGNVLEGSIRKAGDQVRITAQLIDVDGGFHLWSESYDRKLDNIFAVQDEIATAIVEALKLKLDVTGPVTGRTGNVDAYELYLRGKEVGRAPSKEGLTAAINFYEQALSLDDGLAGAYAGIADAWIWLEDYGGIKSAVAYPKAEQAARRAMALDPEMAEAHAAMALLSDRYYDDLITARQYFERAIELNPNLAVAYDLYGDTLDSLGERELLLEMRRYAVELDPLSPFRRARLSGTLTSTGHLDEGKAVIDSILADDPDDAYGHEELGNYYLLKGQLANAVREYYFVHKARPGDAFSASWLAQIGLVMEDSGMAQAWIAEARARGADNRWELGARSELYVAQSDWKALQDAAALWGGSDGATVRGWALINQDKTAEARQSFLNALQIFGYEPGGRIINDYVYTLIGLLWTEQQLGLDDVAPRIAEVEAFVAKLSEVKNLNSGNGNFQFRLALLSAIRGDREQLLGHLNKAVASAYVRFWSLQREKIFAPWRDDPEFIAIVEQLRAHGARERDKLEAKYKG